MNCNTPHKRVYWNRKMVTLFLQLYRENECLYDINNADYNNRSQKIEALKGILNEMRKFLPQLRLEDIRSRIKAIRTQFAHELTLIETAEEAGITYESKLWFFHQLSFLRKHMSRLPPERRCGSSNEHSYDDDSYSDDGGKSLFHELAVNKNSLSEEHVPRKRAVRRRHIKIRWTHDITEKFIKLFQKQQCLYDVDHEDYADRDKRSEARQRLLQDMQQYVPSICLQEVLAKVKCLRTQYTRELRQIALAEENKTTYQPKLWCFHQLSYLKTLYSYDGPSEIGDYANNVSDNSDDMGTTEEDDVRLHTDHDDDGEKAYDESDHNAKNNLIVEIPNKIVPDEPQQLPMKSRFCRVNKENVSKRSSKTEGNADNGQHHDTDSIASGHSYDWLGKLIVSQLDEISPSYRQDFAWDVQSLVRKYILKTKGEIVKTENASTSHSSKTSDQIKELILPNSSNVSLNIRFK